MRLRVSDRDERFELLHYLRANGCIAYVVDEQAIEVLLPGANEGVAIMTLVDDWRTRRARDERLRKTG